MLSYIVGLVQAFEYRTWGQAADGLPESTPPRVSCWWNIRTLTAKNSSAASGSQRLWRLPGSHRPAP